MIILNGHSCDNFLITTKRVSSAEGNSLSIMVDGKEFDKSKSYVIAEISIPSNKVYSLTEMLSKGFISFFKSDNEEELNNLFPYAFNPFSKPSCFEYITMISEYNPDMICKDTTTYRFDKSFSCEENIFIPKVVPGFKYVGKENLRNKTREKKFSLIKKYFDMGYFLTVEVKGSTEGNQNWVAVIDINGSDIV